MGVAADSVSAAREHFMLTSIEQARRSMAAGGPPVGACLVRDGNLVARSQNSVAAEMDITAHAEMVLLRNACRELRSLDLSGCQLYVTVEPCMMCFAACCYANISTVFFGAPVSVMNRYTGNEVPVCDAGKVLGSQPELLGGVLEAQCIELLNVWGSQLPRGQQ
jgi:tRNA(Arg) A34 adenosine deaminase TadA